MGDHDTPTVLPGELCGADGLGDRADLVHLQEQRVARLLLSHRGDAFRVRYSEVVTGKCTDKIRNPLRQT